jgi:hypothetical protein
MAIRAIGLVLMPASTLSYGSDKEVGAAHAVILKQK